MSGVEGRVEARAYMRCSIIVPCETISADSANCAMAAVWCWGAAAPGQGLYIG